MNEKKSIFRKESPDKVSSPEQLNDYIRASRLSVWLILAAVAIMLAGVCVWGVFGKLTTTREVVTVVENGEATCYVSTEDMRALTIDMKVQVADYTGEIKAIAEIPMEIPANFPPYAIHLGGFKVGDWMLPVTLDADVPDGIYMTQIMLETISPISFVLN